MLWKCCTQYASKFGKLSSGHRTGKGQFSFQSQRSESEVSQSCSTLYNPVDCSLPGFSVHGIFQARVLEWVAVSFSRGSSQPRNWTQVSHIAGRRCTIWATKEAQRKAVPKNVQTATQLHSSHTSKVMLKILQARLQQYVNHELQMFKLDLEKTEDPEIKLPTSVGSSEKQESFRKTSISALLTTPKPLTVWITTNCGKVLKEMRIPSHLTCLLRNLYEGQGATVRTGRGTTDWLQVGKGVHQGCILSPCLFNLYAEYIMWNVGLDEAHAVIKIAGRNNNFR